MTDKIVLICVITEVDMTSLYRVETCKCRMEEDQELSLGEPQTSC